MATSRDPLKRFFAMRFTTGVRKVFSDGFNFWDSFETPFTEWRGSGLACHDDSEEMSVSNS